jgi:hypothetical protein
MHALAGVIVKEGTIQEVEAAMWPFDENLEENEDAGNGYWDWWVIGGRFDGLIQGAEYPNTVIIDHDRKLENNIIELDDFIKLLNPNTPNEVINRLVGREKPIIPKVFVTPEPDWYDVEDEEENLIKFLENYKGQGYKIIGVDYHN